MNKPQTHYTKSGRVNIAYQVIGNGPLDLVYIPGWISNIDLMWDCAQLAQFLTALSQTTRVILFDKRGTGLSDRISELSSLEERMDDIRAVMDAVFSPRAILFGHSEGGSVSALFAATYPDRTISLITFGVFARRSYNVGYPWAPKKADRQKVYDMISSSWGSSDNYLASLAPSMAHDLTFMNWLSSYFRSGASPSAALALTKMNTQIDIIDILDSISVPTLLMYRTHDVDVKIEEGRFIAEKIKGATFVEFPGEDHLFWAGDSQSVLSEMIKFVNAQPKEIEVDKHLATILRIEVFHNDTFGKQISTIGNNQEASLEKLIESLISQYRGELIEVNDDTIICTFSGPSKAVNCAVEIQNACKLFSITISQGLHIGEISLRENKIVKGITSKVVEKILEVAHPGQILITNTVNNLLSGTGLEFDQHGVLSVAKNKKIVILLLKDTTALVDGVHSPDNQIYFQELGNKNHSLLEDVLQVIEHNIENDKFTIEELSAELGLSKRQLQRRIKSITNKSPNTLIRSVRLHKAKELIVQEAKSVKEAAFMTGFTTITYFSTCFKREFGQNPSAM